MSVAVRCLEFSPQEVQSSLILLEAALRISLPVLAESQPEIADEVWHLLNAVQNCIQRHN